MHIQQHLYTILYNTFCTKKEEQTKINDFLNINSCFKNNNNNNQWYTTHYRKGALTCASTYKIIINFNIHIHSL